MNFISVYVYYQMLFKVIYIEFIRLTLEWIWCPKIVQQRNMGP